MKTITLVGSGRVAHFFGTVFHAAGIQVLRVIARNPQRGKALATACGAGYSERFDIPAGCDLVLIAVSDDAIAELAALIPLGPYVVCHTSGAVSLSVLGRFSRTAVLYPLQSMRGELSAGNVPLLTEGSEPGLEARLRQDMQMLGFACHPVSSEQRLSYHLAAVFANNFSNAMLTASELILEKKGLNGHMLQALIRHTFENAILFSARQSQTGPALRNDRDTMDRHLNMLRDDEDLAVLYRSVSAFIQTLSKDLR